MLRLPPFPSLRSFVTSIEGCYFNVMGFPLHRFSAEVRKLILEGNLRA